MPECVDGLPVGAARDKLLTTGGVEDGQCVDGGGGAELVANLPFEALRSGALARRERVVGGDALRARWRGPAAPEEAPRDYEEEFVDLGRARRLPRAERVRQARLHAEVLAAFGEVEEHPDADRTEVLEVDKRQLVPRVLVEMRGGAGAQPRDRVREHALGHLNRRRAPRGTHGDPEHRD